MDPFPRLEHDEIQSASSLAKTAVSGTPGDAHTSGITQILVIESQSKQRQRVVSTLSAMGFRVLAPESPQDGFALLSRLDRPAFVLIDVRVSDPSLETWCREIAAANEQRAGIELFATVPRSMPRSQRLLLNAFATDFLVRPLDATEVLYRIQLHLSRVRRGNSSGHGLALDVLLHASEQRSSGELIVNNAGRGARILLHEGRVAWVHVPGESDGLLRMLSTRFSLLVSDLEHVIAEARRLGKSFTALLSEWGLVSSDQLDEALREWLTRRLDAVLSAHPTGVFVSRVLPFADARTFALRDVLSASFSQPFEQAEAALMSQLSSRPPPLETRHPLLTKVMALEAVSSAAILDLDTLRVERARGSQLAEEQLHEIMRSISMLESATNLHEWMITVGQDLHVALRTSADSRQFVYMVASSRGSSHGLARTRLAQILKDCEVP